MYTVEPSNKLRTSDFVRRLSSVKNVLGIENNIIINWWVMSLLGSRLAVLTISTIGNEYLGIKYYVLFLEYPLYSRQCIPEN